MEATALCNHCCCLCCRRGMWDSSVTEGNAPAGLRASQTVPCVPSPWTHAAAFHSPASLNLSLSLSSVANAGKAASPGTGI